MTYSLLTVDPIGPEAMALALAGCFGVAVGDVDVADPDGDPDARNWDAPVSCGHLAVLGDLSWSLDIYVDEGVTGRPQGSDLAARFARAVGTTVLFPAAEAPPSAFWAATPEGLLTRARLDLSDDEPPRYAVTAVEAPVAQLPQATVTRFAEIVREQRPDTPLADAFADSVQRMRESAPPSQRSALDDSTGSPVWSATGNLVVWERVIVQMESGWAPSGWYPAELYRERLQARDELAGLGSRLPGEVAVLLGETLERLDRRFAAATEEDTTRALHEELSGGAAPDRVPGGWWWHRRPDPAPWEQT
ncbi:hypothetical protein AB0N09_02125 [Streptomyces erythrochromogenes]|uniref:hypothetical protein n=1 Tax=Streptomyces erythrochromogenes TaxID=285574 RepID=UPI00343BB0CC